MQKFIARIMATLMLLSVFGQAAAQPCADMHAAAAMTVPTGAPQDMSHDAQVSDALAMPADHCGDMPASVTEKSSTHCTDSATASSDDCGQTCTCCPGHCATVLPPVETTGVPLPRAAHLVLYSDLASSPEPETAIKPPRSA